MEDRRRSNISTIFKRFLFFNFGDLFLHQRYIVECENEVLAPAYLRKESSQEVTFDLTPIMEKYNSK